MFEFKETAFANFIVRYENSLFFDLEKGLICWNCEKNKLFSFAIKLNNESFWRTYKNTKNKIGEFFLDNYNVYIFSELCSSCSFFYLGNIILVLKFNGKCRNKPPTRDYSNWKRIKPFHKFKQQSIGRRQLRSRF